MSKPLAALIGVLMLVAIAGGYIYPQMVVAPPKAAASPVGTTFQNAKFAGIVITPSVGATTTSILNGDANDRYVISTEVGCEGIGTSGAANGGTGGIPFLQLQVGTTSASAPGTIANALSLGYFPIPTSTPNYVFASTTNTVAPGTGSASSTVEGIWKTGSYMTFSFNATNTATCTVGVRYIGS